MYFFTRIWRKLDSSTLKLISLYICVCIIEFQTNQIQYYDKRKRESGEITTRCAKYTKIAINQTINQERSANGQSRSTCCTDGSNTARSLIKYQNFRTLFFITRNQSVKQNSGMARKKKHSKKSKDLIYKDEQTR